MPFAGLIRDSTFCYPEASCSDVEQSFPSVAVLPLSESSEVSRFVSGFPGGRKERPALSRLFGVLGWRDKEPTGSFADSVKGLKTLKRKKMTMGKTSITNNVFAPQLFVFSYTLDHRCGV